MHAFLKLSLLTLLSTSLWALIPFQAGVHEPLAGHVTVSRQVLDFSDRVVNTQSQLGFQLYNGSGDTLHVEDLWSVNPAFGGDFPWPVTILPQDSVLFTVNFNPYTNIAFASVIFLDISEASQSIPFQVLGNGWLLPMAYQPTFNLYDEALEDALAEIFPDQIDLGYSGARMAMYGDIDNFNDSLECVYTGFRQYHEAGSTSTYPDPINCEHSWPQSQFDSQPPMQGDIHHLFPVHQDANSARSNYPFGNVVSNVEWEWGGSRRGWNQYNQRVFEPRDVHKGDAARAIFYFFTRYGNFGNWMNNWQEQDLRNWYWQDPVSQKEIDRNNAIFSYQQNRNPFVDHPYFLHRIKNFLGNINRPDSSFMITSPSSRTWAHPGDQETDTLKILLTNSGQISYTTTGLDLSSATMSLIVTEALTVEPGETEEIGILVRYTQDADSARLIISSNALVDPVQEIPLSFTRQPVGIDPEPIAAEDLQLLSAYPNPFNTSTSLEIARSSEEGKLTIHDLAGRQIVSIVVPGGTGVWRYHWDAGTLPGGVYLARYGAGTRFSGIKLVVLK